ncbi:MAG: peptidoglycan-binding protein [Alphaproteobacteria bacterium]|nr:peptidoglycan-binding protein [Alphaproteobacteria bacterium]
MKPVVSVAALSALMLTSGCAGMFGGGDEASGPPAQRADIMAEQQIEAQRQEVAPPDDLFSQPPQVAQPSQTMAGMEPRRQGAGPAVAPDLIRSVQTQLQQQGYQVGQVDGIYGPQTQAALRQYQQDQGYEASGRLDQQTVLALVGGGPQQAEMPQGQDQQDQQGQQGQQGQGQGPRTGSDSLFERDQQGGSGAQDQPQNQQDQSR